MCSSYHFEELMLAKQGAIFFALFAFVFSQEGFRQGLFAVSSRNSEHTHFLSIFDYTSNPNATEITNLEDELVAKVNATQFDLHFDNLNFVKLGRQPYSAGFQEVLYKKGLFLRIDDNN